jgi:hypothetical protein
MHLHRRPAPQGKVNPSTLARNNRHRKANADGFPSHNLARNFSPLPSGEDLRRGTLSSAQSFARDSRFRFRLNALRKLCKGLLYEVSSAKAAQRCRRERYNARHLTRPDSFNRSSPHAVRSLISLEARIISRNACGIKKLQASFPCKGKQMWVL